VQPASSEAAPTPSSATFSGRILDAYFAWIGRRMLAVSDLILGLGAFAWITTGVLITRFRHARSVVHPLIRLNVARAGIRLLPMVTFLAVALGMVVIGQTVALLSRVGATEFLGPVMVTVVVREVGPLVTALLVLARVGTATVIELGTARSLGEVEALEALGMDPIHYLVVPRVIGMSMAVFSLTVYFVLGALISGYAFVFLQEVPMQPADYFQQLAQALRWEDFVTVGLKTLGFGVLIAMITCYHGLSQPLRLDDVSAATLRAVGQSVVLCVLLDACFILFNLLM
jgi:phospholipid/cholesterol/gamma-HCH transport system permease protein